MNGFRVHHYGLATDNLEKTTDTLRNLGYDVGEISVDPVQRVRVAFASRPEEAMIEVICDNQADGPTNRIVSKSGCGLYHICYLVDDLEGAMKKMRDKGFLLIHAPVPAIACHGKRIAWLYSRYIGLIELVENEELL